MAKRRRCKECEEYFDDDILIMCQCGHWYCENCYEIKNINEDNKCPGCIVIDEIHVKLNNLLNAIDNIALDECHKELIKQLCQYFNDHLDEYGLH